MKKESLGEVKGYLKGRKMSDGDVKELIRKRGGIGMDRKNNKIDI